MKPKIIKKAAFQVVGYRFEANLQEIKDDNIVKNGIAKLKEHTHEIANKTGDHIFLIQIYPMKENFDAMSDKFITIIGYEVSKDGNRPADTIVQSIDENLYALYRHRGLESDLQHSYDYLYGRWLNESGNDSLGYDLEVLDERYQPEEPTNEIDMYIAIRNR